MHRKTVSKHAVPAVLVAVMFAAGMARAADPVAESQEHQREAIAAYQAADYVAFTRSLERAHELNPASYWTRYHLAGGYALTGRSDDALALLEDIVKARIDFGMAADDDLRSLRELPAFQALVTRLEASIAPVANSTHRLTIGQLGLIPEGIAIDADSGRLFFGSIRSGDIFAVEADGSWSKFATVEHEGPLAAVGMTVDRARGVLWSVGASFSTVEGFDADAPVRTGVFGFDLSSGELRHRHLAGASVRDFNDVTLAPSGDLYVSGDVLHVLRAGENSLEPVNLSHDIYGANGITTNATGDKLFVSSYPVGIAVIDVATGRTRFLDTTDTAPLYGIDGLYWHDGDLIGIQNGVKPWRIVRIALDDALTSVTGVRHIEFANDSVEATTGAIDGDRMHYVGQGPAPDPLPAHFDAALARFPGATIIMTAPLD